MKNKKHQLKPSLFLCVLMAAAILLVFVMATNVNKNVAKNFKGTILYGREDSAGKNALVLYYFETDNSVVISEDCEFGFFSDKDTVVYAIGTEVYRYNILDKKSEKVASLDCDRILEVSLFSDGQTLIASGVKDEQYGIYGMDGKAICSVQGKITGLKGEYFAVNSQNTSKVYKLGLNGTATEMTGFEGVTGAVSVTGNAVIVVRDDKAIAHKTDFSKEGILRFSTPEYVIKRVVPVTDTQFLVTAEKDGITDMYMCNGSNIVKVDKISTEAASEYIYDCRK